MTATSHGGATAAVNTMSRADAKIPAHEAVLERRGAAEDLAVRAAAFGGTRGPAGRDARNTIRARKKLAATASLRLPSIPSDGIKIKPLAKAPPIAPRVLTA